VAQAAKEEGLDENDLVQNGSDYADALEEQKDDAQIDAHMNEQKNKPETRDATPAAAQPNSTRKTSNDVIMVDDSQDEFDQDDTNNESVIAGFGLGQKSPSAAANDHKTASHTSTQVTTSPVRVKAVKAVAPSAPSWPSADMASLPSTASTPTSAPRGRGRPRRVPTGTTPPPRPRGRPPKHPVSAQAANSSLKRALPIDLTEDASNASASEDNGAGALAAFKKQRATSMGPTAATPPAAAKGNSASNGVVAKRNVVVDMLGDETEVEEDPRVVVDMIEDESEEEVGADGAAALAAFKQPTTVQETQSRASGVAVVIRR